MLLKSCVRVLLSRYLGIGGKVLCFGVVFLVSGVLAKCGATVLPKSECLQHDIWAEVVRKRDLTQSPHIATVQFAQTRTPMRIAHAPMFDATPECALL